jgi:tRNA nucleotidyltransferase (CCA-adding enzyme)
MVIKKQSHKTIKKTSKVTPARIKKRIIKRKKRINPEQIPRTAHNITSMLNRHGATCYIVGGFPRDTIRGISAKDIDIEVHGLDIDTIAQILSKHFSVNYVGKSFGVLKVKEPGSTEEIDVSVPRADSVGRKPDVTFFKNATPKDAASRRDFTINALMWDTKTNTMVDPYGGMQDLKSGTIRSISQKSFTDDPLRVVRAAQFASRFGYSIEPETVTMAKQSTLHGLSMERIREEMLKALLKSKAPSRFFNSLDGMGQLSAVFPEIAILKSIPQDEYHHPEGNVYTHTMMVLDRVPNDPILRLTALLHDTGKAVTTSNSNGRIKSIGHERQSTIIAERFLRKFKFDNATIKMVLPLVDNHMIPGFLINSGTKITLAKKNALIARVAGGYSKIMRDPREALEKYKYLISFAIADHGADYYSDKFLTLPPIQHYVSHIDARALSEKYQGKALGDAIVERYTNQINTPPKQMRKMRKLTKR